MYENSVVTTRPVRPEDIPNGGVLTCEYDWEMFELTNPHKDPSVVFVRNDSERASYGGSDGSPLSSNFGTPSSGSPMQGITVP